MSVSLTLQQLHYIPWNLLSRPWARLLIDYAESQYLLISAHSNWIEALPAESLSSSVTIELVFAWFGLPEFIVLSCFCKWWLCPNIYWFSVLHGKVIQWPHLVTSSRFLFKTKGCTSNKLTETGPQDMISAPFISDLTDFISQFRKFRFLSIAIAYRLVTLTLFCS